MRNKHKVQIYTSFEEENRAERIRRSQLNTEARIREFSAIQERQWGKNWTTKHIVKKASYETVNW